MECEASFCVTTVSISSIFNEFFAKHQKVMSNKGFVLSPSPNGIHYCFIYMNYETKMHENHLSFAINTQNSICSHFYHNSINSHSLNVFAERSNMM